MNFSDAFMSSDIRKWMSLYDPTMVILYLSCFFFFHVITICGANRSLLWCVCTAPGSQRSPVNQCGCYSNVSFLGFSLLMRILSWQLALFFLATVVFFLNKWNKMETGRFSRLLSTGWIVPVLHSVFLNTFLSKY